MADCGTRWSLLFVLFLCHLQGLCSASTNGFFSLEEVERAAENNEGVITPNRLQVLFPSINFTEPQNITSWSFVAVENNDPVSIAENLPQLQVWRRQFDSYIRVANIGNTSILQGSGPSLYQYVLPTPISVLPGDVLGIHIPQLPAILLHSKDVGVGKTSTYYLQVSLLPQVFITDFNKYSPASRLVPLVAVQFAPPPTSSPAALSSTTALSSSTPIPPSSTPGPPTSSTPEAVTSTLAAAAPPSSTLAPSSNAIEIFFSSSTNALVTSNLPVVSTSVLIESSIASVQLTSPTPLSFAIINTAQTRRASYPAVTSTVVLTTEPTTDNKYSILIIIITVLAVVCALLFTVVVILILVYSLHKRLKRKISKRGAHEEELEPEYDYAAIEQDTVHSIKDNLSCGHIDQSTANRQDAILVISMNENMAYGLIVTNQLSATDHETVDQSIVNQQTDTNTPVIKMDDNVAYGQVNQLSATDHVETSLDVVYEQVLPSNSNQDLQEYENSSDSEYY